MKFDDLASVVFASKRKGTDLLISMPAYTEYQVVFDHLRLLSMQDFQDLDLVLQAVLALSTRTR